MKTTVKIILDAMAAIVTFLPSLIALMGWNVGHTEGVFLFFAHAFGKVPGKPGEYLRRAYYRMILRKVGRNLVVGFGSFFTHMDCVLGDSVWIGQYTIIGSADIGDNVLVSDHISLLSGRYHHAYERGMLVTDADHKDRISIGSSTWIGAGSIVMADVGQACIVGAGSVVVHPVQSSSVVGGNPARFIKNRDGG